MQVHIIRTDGTEEHVEARREDIAKLIGSPTGCLDGFNLRDGRYCFVDDTGMCDGREINPKATALYHRICKPGTVNGIHGDVAIVRNAECR